MLTVLEILQSLGDTPEEVATTLRGWGLCGMRCSRTSCPIAALLRGLGFTSVDVGRTESIVFIDGKRQRTWNPKPVEQFAWAFDLDNRFTELRRA